MRSGLKRGPRLLIRSMGKSKSKHGAPRKIQVGSLFGKTATQHPISRSFTNAAASKNKKEGKQQANDS
eukprot:4409684-Amphidinium_carterae.1